MKAAGIKVRVAVLEEELTADQRRQSLHFANNYLNDDGELIIIIIMYSFIQRPFIRCSKALTSDSLKRK